MDPAERGGLVALEAARELRGVLSELKEERGKIDWSVQALREERQKLDESIAELRGAREAGDITPTS